ncbi:MAG: Ig-like domain-containing protein, partial [Planctomycetota bacterium]|nr:Ig-like domain-containing protein [Planctomycetota bacterium]
MKTDILIPQQFGSKPMSKLPPIRLRRLFLEHLEDRRMLAAIWQNPLVNVDVTDDGFVVADDVITLINYINSHGSGGLVGTPSPTSPYLDVDGDTQITASDVVSVINNINAGGLKLPLAMGLVNDTGESPTDRVTYDPRLQGQLSLEGITLATAKVRVNRGAIVDLPIDVAGHFTLDPRTVQSLQDGNSKVTVYLPSLKGLQQIQITLDTVAPTLTSPRILAADDSGLKNDDNNTSVTQPRITLAAEVGELLLVQFNGQTLFDGPSTGAFENQPTLTDGTYPFSAIVRDVAGNSASANISIVVDTTVPPAPQFDLAATSDTGARGDGSTNAARVTLQGSTEANSFVTIAGLNQTVRSSGDGKFRIPNIPLTLGENGLSLAVTDLAGNTSQAARTLQRVAETAGIDPVLRWNQAILNAIVLDATPPP